MPAQSIKSDKGKQYDWYSDHSVSITNMSNNRETYKITYNHDIPNIVGGQPLSFDITLEPNQTYNDNRRYTTKINIRTKDVYLAESRTLISQNGKNLKTVKYQSSLTVF